jgi:uncharacterized protein (DUF2141 family)
MLVLCFSNNVRGRLGSAAYEKARFEFNVKRVRVEIEVK